jgi:hypothetical protein
MGFGKRRAIRRQADSTVIFIVDQFSPALFLPIAAILFLSVFDALLTLFLIGHGAYETNPVMAYYLKLGPYIFFTVKYALTSLGVVFLLVFRNRILPIIKVSALTLLYLMAGIFLAIVAWEVYLVSRILGWG